jgi:hypothetical protein
MSVFYRKPKLGPNLHRRILDLCRSVSAYVESKHPGAHESDYFGLCPNKDSEIVSYLDFESHNDTHYPLQATLDQALIDLPKLKEFFDEFNMHPYIGKAIAGNWGTHRHAFAPDALWNMCVLDEGTDGTSVQFHYLADGGADYGPCIDGNYYDHLDSNREKITELTLTLDREDIYLFSTWDWHSYIVPNHRKTGVYLLYFQNAKTQEDIDKIVTKLESYD